MTNEEGVVSLSDAIITQHVLERWLERGPEKIDLKKMNPKKLEEKLKRVEKMLRKSLLTNLEEIKKGENFYALSLITYGKEAKYYASKNHENLVFVALEKGRRNILITLLDKEDRPEMWKNLKHKKFWRGRKKRRKKWKT